MVQPMLKKLLVTTFLVAASSGFSFAQDINAVGDRLKAVLEQQGMKANWTAVTGDASEMVLEGVTLTMAGNPQALAVGKVTLSDVTEENGGYKIGSLTMPDYNVVEGETTIAANGIEISGLQLAAQGSTDPLANLMMYESADMESFSVTVAGKQAFSMKGARAEITRPTETEPMTFSMNTDGFTADLSDVKDMQSQAVIDALGYRSLSGNIALEGTWNMKDGRANLTQYDMTVDNAGTLGMTFDLGGYTLDFLKQIQDMQKKMAEQPAGADNSAQGLAMLGMMQQLTFNAAAIRFEDDSLTNKVLDYVAKQQGMKASDIANQVKALAPIMLAQLGLDQATMKNVSDAVNTYLSEPKSLEISAAPPQPVPFAMIAAGAMSPTPQDLIKTLSITINANQD